MLRIKPSFGLKIGLKLNLIKKTRALGERKPPPRPLIPKNSYYWHYYAEMAKKSR